MIMSLFEQRVGMLTIIKDLGFLCLGSSSYNVMYVYDTSGPTYIAIKGFRGQVELVHMYCLCH